MTRREQRDAEREIRRLLDDLISTDTRRLVEAWALTWDQVSSALVAAIEELTNAAAGGRVTRSMVLNSQRLQLALDAVIDSLTNVTGQAARQIENTLRQAVDATVPRWVAMIGTTIPNRGPGPQIVAGLQAANPAAITAMIRRATENITHDMSRMAGELATIIRGELLRGISVGDNPRAAARRMVRRVEDRWDYSLSRAMTVARTETIDAHRAAARATEEANTDVLAGWEWSTHLDARTCRACIAMHGRRFPLDQPGPEGHQNCRCARRPIPKTWRDLGINLPDTTPTQADREREVDDFLAGLSPEELQRILGQRGLAAYEAGNFPVEDWVRVRQNPGWRDSRVPAPAPAAA